MKINIKLIEELETNTEIEWWNKNREKINEAIRMYNDWQINHKQDEYQSTIVLAKVDSIRRWNNECNSELNDWQLQILDEIESHVNDVIQDKEMKEG